MIQPVKPDRIDCRTYKRDKPRYQRERSPNDAVGISRPRFVDAPSSHDSITPIDVHAGLGTLLRRF